MKCRRGEGEVCDLSMGHVSSITLQHANVQLCWSITSKWSSPDPSQARDHLCCLLVISGPGVTMNGLLDRLARFAKTTKFLLLRTIQRRIISIKYSWLFSPATQPNAWRAVTGRRDLYQSRIFRPPKQDDTRALPVVIIAHGGGFIFNGPAADDALARYLADHCACYVVSIDYRKAPSHVFPAAYDDIVETVLSLLKNDNDNADLHIDRSRVVLMGTSAGGNLMLAAAQDSQLQDLVLGVVGIQAVVNLAASGVEQMATRPDPSVPDFVGDGWSDVIELYVGTTDATTLKDPRISPTFFKERDDLPKHVFMIGCEHDMTCHELKSMANRLVDGAASQEQLAAQDWQVDDVHWTLVKGQTHAFEHFPKKGKAEEEARLRDRDKLFQDIAGWLRNVFGTT